MMEFTLTEMWLIVWALAGTAYTLKYREEAKVAKHLLKAMLREQAVYDRMKADHDTFMKEMKDAETQNAR
jgi:hypothetical protein